MDQTIVSIILAATSLVVGVVAGRVFFAKNTKKQIEEANTQAANILKEAELRAETIKKEKQLEARERFVHHINLPIQVFFDGFISFDLFV